MQPPDPHVLIERVQSLPAARPLLARLGDELDVHLVGGAVRDLLLGGAPVDLDLVTQGDPEALASQVGGEVRQHDRFGTATVVLDGRSYDIARARRERYARPGALPDVEPASLSEDLGRRDFTVNAMAITLAGGEAGRLHVVPEALDDLDARRLRVLHDRSFIDDPTRLFRLARYASRLGFSIEPHTRELARAALDADALRTVSGERIGAELRLLAQERDPVAALQTAADLGLTSFDSGLAARALKLLPPDGRRDLLVLAVALSGKADRLGFEAGDRDTIVAAARPEELAGALARASKPSEIWRAVGGAGPELVAIAGALGPAEAAREWLERLRDVRLEIDGTDLRDAGVPEGPRIGEGLRAARAAKLDGRATSREEELTEALRAAR